MITALVEIAKDSRTPLVPSVVMGGAGGEAGTMAGGLPGLLLALAAKDLVPKTEALLNGAADGPGRR
ncbi:hypothetical protein [Lichenibacterium dinghuense]|uniref:hypothetical protein n=1 Tax=Lichenibacterium dinghuense TaxID=2895977 RepID=UPI001F3D7A8E|nr:hypothetical protein [Lichenibacterium sp. 6Y81]